MTRWDPWGQLADILDPREQQQPELADPVTLATHLDPAYQPRAHLRIIAAHLARLRAGDGNRLMVNTPPQVGKSVTAVDWGAFWWLAHHPTTNIVIGSYDNGLAMTRGRNIRKLVRLYGARYNLHLEPGSASMKDWRITAGGGVRSVGVGAGITGHPADLIYIDDPTKSRAEAESLTRRDAIWMWYSADLLSRQSPGAVIIIIQTPWHPDDLRGRILAQEGDESEGGRWRVVVMPALATSPNDPLGRAEGEPLPHPKIPEGDHAATLRHWQSIRASLTGAVREWHSLYQCDPKPTEGTLLSWQVLRDRRCFEPGRGGCAAPATVAVAVDPSGGGRDTAGIVGGYLGIDGRLYWTHDHSGVMASDLWARSACELAADTGADRFIVEINYGGDMATLALRTAWDALRREQPERFGMFCPRIVVVRARRGKLLRAEPIAQQVIEGRILLAAYLPDLESEWATWRPGMDSPGRIDASVHMAYDLLPVPASGEASLVGAGLLSEAILTSWRS
jgi:hypothetical protein